MISTIIGKVLADMTEDSRQRILQWKRTEKKDPNDPQSPLTADYMEQAYELQDWLLVFEIAMVTHLHVDQAVDETAMLQRQEMQLEKYMSCSLSILETCTHVNCTPVINEYLDCFLALLIII
jgi:hypothetical protein